MRVQLWFLALALAACSDGPTDDGFSKDPTAIDALIVTPEGIAVAGRGVMLISSDGKVQTLASDATGHVVAYLADPTAQATLYSDAKSPEGRTMVQGVVPGDHICVGCKYTTTDCPGLPAITGLHRISDGWVWTITGEAPYVGMEISWKPASNNPNGAGFLLSPPGNMSASTNNSADITIVLFTRADLATYDDLRTLSVDGWKKKPFCAATTHGT